MSQKFKTTPKPSPKNTLFNYFKSNTPKTEEKKEESEAKNEKQLTSKKLDYGTKYFSFYCFKSVII